MEFKLIDVKRLKKAFSLLSFKSPEVPTSGENTSLSFIDSISQTNGKIYATKKNIPTYGLKLVGNELSIVTDGSGSASITLPSSSHAVSATYLRPEGASNTGVFADANNNLFAHTVTLE